MALDEKDFERINALIDLRAGDWRSEAKDAARAEARSEVKAVDERVAKRNTVFGAGVGAVVLALASGAYATLNKSINDSASVSLSAATTEAGRVAEEVAQAQLSSGSDLVELQEKMIEKIVESRGKVEVALNVASTASESAETTAIKVAAMRQEMTALVDEAKDALENAEAQTEQLSALIARSGKQGSDLQIALTEAEKARERLKAEADEFENARVQLREAQKLLRDVRRGDNPIAETAKQIVEVAIKDPEISSLIASAAEFPAEAVVAFGPAGFGKPICPDRWSVFDDAEGRFILGAQEKIHDVGKKDGSETVTLTEAQMPRHGHKLIVSGEGDSEGLRENSHIASWMTLQGDKQKYSYSIAKKAGTPNTGLSEEIGGSKPHPNMPPYIALYFCKKD